MIRNIQGEATEVEVKCQEFDGIIRWNEFCPFYEISGSTFKKYFWFWILRMFEESRDFVFEQICDQRQGKLPGWLKIPNIKTRKIQDSKNTYMQ